MIAFRCMTLCPENMILLSRHDMLETNGISSLPIIVSGGTEHFPSITFVTHPVVTVRRYFLIVRQGRSIVVTVEISFRRHMEQTNGAITFDRCSRFIDEKRE